MSHFKTAPVNMFTTLRPRLFIGKFLQDVKSIQASIARFGLLSPILVSRVNNQLIVIDGRKRLAAIRRLEFMGERPRSLVNIPYIELEDARRAKPHASRLMSNRDLYMTVTEMFQAHQNVAQIAQDLYLSRNCVKQILMLARLSPRLRRIFFDQIINFSQARAYATLPEHKAQERAFMALGPFSEAEDILDYAKRSESVVGVPQRLAA